MESSQALGLRSLSREEAFESLFREQYTAVLGFALRRSPDRDSAEDVTEETFVTAWRKFDDAPVAPKAWLLAIARNVLANHARGRRRQARLRERVRLERGPDTSAQGSQGEFVDIVEALSKLSDADQEVLRLVAWDGLRADEAGAVLGCTSNAFSVRLHRARDRLSRALDHTDNPRTED